MLMIFSLFHRVVLLHSVNSIFISLKDGWFLHGSLISGHLLLSQFCGAASSRQSKVLENKNQTLFLKDWKTC